MVSEVLVHGHFGSIISEPVMRQGIQAKAEAEEDSSASVAAGKQAERQRLG